ncbi:MAG: twin-arginine translocase TatA/TatE family subunit [Lentisphaerae bacterium]|nr:twin-arginine translocase TatA/TatE family subunit [Lentisphaerota bacterium]
MSFRNIGITELIVILIVVLVLFGAKRIPEIARALGKSLSEFKKGQVEGNITEPENEEDEENEKNSEK